MDETGRGEALFVFMEKFPPAEGELGQVQGFGVGERQQKARRDAVLAGMLF
jgi:hypothetical protein